MADNAAMPAHKESCDKYESCYSAASTCSGFLLLHSLTLALSPLTSSFLPVTSFLRWANSQDSKLIALAPPSSVRLLWSQLALSRRHRLCTSLIFQPSSCCFR